MMTMSTPKQTMLTKTDATKRERWTDVTFQPDIAAAAGNVGTGMSGRFQFAYIRTWRFCQIKALLAAMHEDLTSDLALRWYIGRMTKEVEQCEVKYQVTCRVDHNIPDADSSVQQRSRYK